MDITKDGINALLDAGKSLASAQVLPGAEPFAVLPQNCKIENLAHLLPPTRIKTQVALDTPDAFAAYVNRFKDDDTLLFATVTDTGAKFMAVLDYHCAAPAPVVAKDDIVIGEAHPRHLSHVARFECQCTTEWLRWMKANGVKMSQTEFAVWLEDNQDLFVSPNGAELLELVISLEGKSEVRFNSAIRLNSGKNALVYDEDVLLQGNAGASRPGKIEVPQMVELGIAPFHGVPVNRVSARLKYRIEARKLSFWFETVTPHRIVREAVLGILDKVEESTGLEPLMGSVPV